MRAVIGLLLLAISICVHAKNYGIYSRDKSEFNRLSPRENAKLQMTCGQAEENTKRLMIASGAMAERKHIPWAASFSRDIPAKNWCGATLISPRHLLTAAHCMFEYEVKALPCSGPKALDNFETMSILLGGVCVEENESSGCKSSDMKPYQVRAFAASDEFNSKGCEKGSDWAIIELVDDVPFDDSIKPICLPPKEVTLDSLADALDKMTDVHSFGLGRRCDGATSRLYSFKSHLNKPVDPSVDGDTFETTSVKSGDGMPRARICSGDSGAGLVGKSLETSRYSIVGIHSSGDNCGLFNCNTAPNPVYTSTFVGSHLEDICELTGVCSV